MTWDRLVRFRGQVKITRRRWLPVAAIAALAALLYLWQLDRSGYANAYYSAAAQAASQSWSAFFFGSIDAGNFVTVDKPPFALWIMGLSVRLFGLSPWSILVPEALMGVAAVVVLFDVVRRSFGYAAGLIAALAFALTPVAVLMFRYNNPDAALTLLFVTAAWCLVRALETGRTRWLVASVVVVGFAFDTKFLQGFMVVPALGITYLVAGPRRLRTRLAQLVVTGAVLLVSSGWWMTVVDAIPASARPYIGGSGTNSVFALAAGYDGLGRVFGEAFGRAVNEGIPQAFGFGGGPGSGFSGTPGWTRLFGPQMAGEASWLIPFAVLSLVVGLILTARAPRTDAARAGFLLWGIWAITHWAVFSFSSGIIHSYYEVALAPSIAALVGGGVVTLVWLRSRTPLATAAIALGVGATAWWSYTLLGRTPSFAPGLGVLVLVVAAAGVLLFIAPRQTGALRVVPQVAAALCVAAMLFGPTSYALATVNTPDGGGDPHAGPSLQPAAGRGFGGGAFGVGRGAARGGAPDGPALPAPARVPTDDGGPFATITSQPLLSYLLERYQGETWLVAVNGANEAAQIQLATGRPVMAMGGFSGSDPVPTLTQLQTLVREGKLRFVILSGGGPGGFGGPGFGGPGFGSRGRSDVTQWITSAGTPVTIGNVTVYDLGALEPSASR